MRLLPLLAAAFLIAAPSAGAATLNEVPPLALFGEEDCFDVTGTPGEVTVPATGGVRFVQATRSGFQPGQVVKLGESFECGATATRPSGAGVIAGRVDRALVVAIRDPGGAWSAPVTVAAASETAVAQDIAAAVSDRGDVIVAWREYGFDKTGSSTVRVARRAPGGAFSPPESLPKGLSSVQPALAATGEAFLLTMTPLGGDALKAGYGVDVRVAPAGGGFGAPARLGTATWISTPAIDVAPDGRALVALLDGTSVLVSEREPGAAFAAAAPLAPAKDDFAAAVTVKLGAGAAAAIAWRRYIGADVQVATRTAAGPFSAPITALQGPSPVPAGYDPFYFSRAYFAALLGPFDDATSTTTDSLSNLALTPDGRALVTMSGYDGRDATQRLATVPLAGGPVASATGLPLFASDDNDEPIALVLADGTPAALWVDSRQEQGVSRPPRLRLAAENTLVALTPPRVPKVTIGAPRDRTLGVEEALRLPVTCNGPCEVRAVIDKLAGAATLDGTVRLRKAGRAELEIPNAAYAAPAQFGRVRIRVATGAPGALYPSVRTISVRIRHTANAGPPEFHRLRARRAGDRIRVTFRVARDAEGGFPLFISGDDTRGYNGDPLVTRSVSLRSGKRDYSVSLPALDGLRYVVVRLPFFLEGTQPVVAQVR